MEKIKPTSENQQRVNEYILQARADLKRCDGNLERAWKAMEEGAEEAKNEPGNTPSDDHFTDEDHAQDQHFEEASAMAEELYSVIGFSR